MFVDIPNNEERREILRLYTKQINHKILPHEFDQLAEVTVKYSGADIERLVKGAAEISRENITKTTYFRRSKVTKHFLKRNIKIGNCVD